MQKKELRIGVIGAAGRGELAWEAHLPEEGVSLVAATDIFDKPLQAFKDKFGPDVFITKDYQEMLARGDIDAIFVTSPDFMHEEHAVACLQAGKDVYLEKPMAITIKGCDAILETAKETGQKLFVGHNMRYSAFVIKMKEPIRFIGSFFCS
ncbi:MAG: Gfo/Idh/MocA family oxidoreductase [Proteobacteria bacterium]|nr:Gfo/Idh/MocA family oxidoreductase [Pseudomonadota bacterium]